MKSIQVYGSGCQKCDQLKVETEKALQLLGFSIEIDKVTDYALILLAGVVSTPALSVDGKLIFQGEVKKAEEIKSLLSD